MKTVGVLLVSMVSVGVGCAGDPAVGDGENDSFVAVGKGDTNGFDDGTPQALGVLRVANEASLEILLYDVGLSKRPAKNILAARPFATLAALDAVPYVGVRVFRALDAYSHAEGYDAPVAKAGAPLTLATSSTSFACGITDAGNVLCWGSGTALYSGYGPPTAQQKFTSLGSGDMNMCGVETSGSAACWGSNFYGQSDAPTTVSYKLVAGTTAFYCGLRSDNGHINCWGSLGYRGVWSPAGSFVSIDAGGGLAPHACGVREGGALECWFPDGTAETAPAGTFSQVSIGELGGACAVQSDGEVVCFGRRPLVPPAGKYVQVTVGSDHACGLRTDGTVACWGGNGYGQATAPAGTFVSVSAGNYFTCGVRTDGHAACWGNNNSGQASPPDVVFKH